MPKAKIHGAEFPISKIFSNDFNFRIPLYQRPYSWTTEEAGELIADLLSFIDAESAVRVDDLSPYFLGSMVLIKDESLTDAEVVDGQRRLTTLTILLAALRATISTPNLGNAMTEYLYQEGNPIEGTANQYRLTIRDRDAEFFRSYIQESDQIKRLTELDAAQLTDSQQNIRRNALLFLGQLEKLAETQRTRLAQFIVKNCFLVVVSTPDLDSAYRIFSILNDRGLDLSHSDILKSELIGSIPAEQQEALAKDWEDTEEQLGQDAFSDLFGHIRMIYVKAKAKETILKEFRKYVIQSKKDARKIINDVIIPLADAFSTIRLADYKSTVGAERVNEMLEWLSRIDNTDWIPPAILFLSRNKNDSQALGRFLEELERLAAYFMVCRRGVNERIERYARLLSSIEVGKDIHSSDSPLQLTDVECRIFVRELNGEIYMQTPKRRLYLLLRLDSALSDGTAKYDHTSISIEHVLPQSPPAKSKWCEWFPTPELRERWLHRLANLLLISSKKNSSASNYEFDKKKTAYFTRGGVSPFAITTQVIGEDEWTPAVVEARQKALLETLVKAWRINTTISLEQLLAEVDFMDTFEDDEAVYGEAREPMHSVAKSKRIDESEWTGYWFVNVGDSDHRNWDDCRKYGFLAAGYGSQYRDALKKLKAGSKVYAYRSPGGYVGFGEITKEAVMVRDFVANNGKRLLDLSLKSIDIDHDIDDPNLCEWVIGVKWHKTVSRDDSRRFSGAFAVPNVVCKLRHEPTLEYLKQEFGF